MVRENDSRRRVRIEDDVIMLAPADFGAGRFVIRCPQSSAIAPCINGDASAHAQMNLQRLSVIEIRHDVFGAPPQLLHSTPSQTILKVRRKRNSQIAST